MRKSIKTAVLVAALAAVSIPSFAQSSPTGTSPGIITEYQQKAAYMAGVVIDQVDELKAYQESPDFADLFTSATVQDAYEDRLTTFATTLRTVQDGLLSTATGVLNGGRQQLRAARQMLKYREETY